MWSPPSVITRGSVLPFIAGPLLSASVAGVRERILKWPSSICLRAHVLSYLVTVSALKAHASLREKWRESYVLRGNRDVTTVENSRPAVEWVGLQGNIVPSTDFVVS